VARFAARLNALRFRPATSKESGFEMSFENLGLAEPLLRAVRSQGYDAATPIQCEAIPMVLTGSDLMACAQTGTGKTAAFVLPMLQQLFASSNFLGNEDFTSAARQPRRDRRKDHRLGVARQIRSLILAPTRELAGQIASSIAKYGKFTGLRCAVVYGGVGQGPQVRALEAGVDILVATPGRLLDLIEQGFIDLSTVRFLVLDEADQMLDMGFIVPLRRIVARAPRNRQTLMFSATMPAEIRKLASEWLRDPGFVQIGPIATPVESVDQSVYFVEPRNKPQLLAHYLQNTAFTRTLVFARTKHGADKIVKQLTRSGIRAAALHGNKSQNVRERTLQAFKSTRPPVLIATDIASRGLDVQGVSHVINYELPEVAEVYVHRIGRTARAGNSGVATSFCARDERGQLRQIERLTRRTIQVNQCPPELITQFDGCDDRSPNNRHKMTAPSSRPPRRSVASHGVHSSRRRNRGRRRRPAAKV
jgi:ATP-dependent RNA helicase RhlE